MSARAMRRDSVSVEGLEDTFATGGATGLGSSRVVSALNGRTGADIIVPPYQQLVETEYLPPNTPHWTQECLPVEGEAENRFEEFEELEYQEILQPRRLSLRVF